MRIIGKCRNRFLLFLIMLFAFTVLWTFVTLLLIAISQQAEEIFISRDGNRGPAAANSRYQGDGKDDYLGRGIQVVVGHYNGKLPDKPKVNLTSEQLNSNRYAPVEDAGAMGRALRLSMKEEVKGQELFGINQFNIIASDKIPLNRSLPDIRKRACRDKRYPSILPSTSVIIVFHNEAWSTLLRTVISVVNRSPQHLLHEIILVDDASQRQFLQDSLETFIHDLPTRIVLVRAPARVGLIRARLMGANEAQGDVLTFLDSHCEVTDGWLEPMLARISEDRTVAVCPIIDVINDQTFAYQRGIELFRGGFNWNLQFRWYSIPPDELIRRREDPAMPIRSPTMAGGLFSIDRKYFYEIGSYDNQMDIWGGENLEMSFRIWQCGGKIEILPCSHVGHVFRKASPHDFPDKKSGSILNSNLARAAEVWMDEWKHLFYKTAPEAYDLSKALDVSERLALKSRLKCRNFTWYLDHVWKDHFLPAHGAFFGRIGLLEHQQASPDDLCLTSMPGEAGKRRHTLQLKKCTLGFDMWQFWVYNADQSIRSDEHQCLGASEISKVWILELRECAEVNTEKWIIQASASGITGQIRHKVSSLCLDRREGNAADKSTIAKKPTLRKCSRFTGSTQQWSLKPVNWKSPSKAFA